MVYKDLRYSTRKGTVEQKEGMRKNGKRTKRCSGQTYKRVTRSYCAAIPAQPTHARLPNNNQNKKKLRRILRTQHHLSVTSQPRKKRLRKQPMEHEHRKTQKNLPTNKRRTKHAKLHRKHSELAAPKNGNELHATDEP
jgi:hypothetical protein